jgi:phosphoribosylamine--glycine ligase
MSLPVMPTRILVLGGGAREHALAWKLAAEPGVNQVAVAPGSAAIGAESRVRCLAGVDPQVPAAVVAAAREMSAELVVIGPEAPLAAGVADALGEAGIAVFGPTRAAARIETSKAFCHDVAAAAGVRMARSRTFAGGELEAARSFASELGATGRGLVVKADGLAAGKGVFVCDDPDAADPYIEALLRPESGIADGAGNRPRAVIEERLFGPEASVIAIVDGHDALALPAARDHKRLCDGDRGPNTGGMGAYSPLADLSDADAAGLLGTIHRPLLVELARRGSPFRGFLYAGLILTDDGPVLLECNARLGDPEAQVILPRLAGPIGPVLLAAARGDLGPVRRSSGPVSGGSDTLALPVFETATVGIVLAAKGYPNTPKRGDPISGLDDAASLGGLVFHAGTIGRPGGGYGTSGGRVLTVVGRGSDLATARATAERAAEAIAWDGLQRRHDIAADAPSLAGAAGGGR